MRHKIPFLLIYSRFFIGTAVILLSIQQVDNYRFIAVFLMSIGLLTDIFDGIIARKLNISTQNLRRLDSSADLFFFLSFALATYLQCPDFFENNQLKTAVLVSFEGLTYFICFIKFRKEIATHTIGAKMWTLLLFACLSEIILKCHSGLLFDLCFWGGILTRLEIAAIILVLKKWTNDVPTVYHACLLRHGKEIKRHKIFNG